MGFSRSSSRTNSTVNTYNFANYGGEGGGGAPLNLAGLSLGNVSGRNAQGGDTTLTLNMSDYGAIQGGLDLAQSALSHGSEALSSAIGRTLDIANKTQVSESAQFQDTLLKLGLIGGIALVALAFAKRRS